MPTKKELLNQLHSLRLTGFEAKLAQHATAHGLPIPFFFAIASRETNCINELGDYRDGEYHGIGIVQIDIQHDIARQMRDDGTWNTNPDPLIEFGAQLLEDNIKTVQKTFPGLSEQVCMKVAASGFNCGISRAIDGYRNGDSDEHTTGGDYGRDVMTRMAIFDELIQQGA